MIFRDGRSLAMFLPSLEMGGAETVSVTLANGLAARGVAVSMLLARKSGALIARLDPSIGVRELGGAGVMAAVPALAGYLREKRPDAILSMMTHANVAAALAICLAGKRKTRLILSERMSLAARDHFYSGPKERVLRVAMRALYRVSDMIVVPSRQMLGALARHTGLPLGTFRVIGNPVIDAGFAERARQPWPWGESLKNRGARLVVAVGRLSAVKDHATLIAAFAGVDGPGDTHLVIVGEGEERAHLEAFIAQLGLGHRVHLPGYSENPLPAIRLADVFALSSRYEGLPNVLIEALACGTRCVSTDCSTGPHEILEGGALGLLVPVGDVGALRTAIGTALSAPEWPDTRVRCSEFDVSRVLEEYLDVLFPRQVAREG